MQWNLTGPDDTSFSVSFNTEPVSYGVYDQQPIDQPDEWGDLASWQSAAGAS